MLLFLLFSNGAGYLSTNTIETDSTKRHNSNKNLYFTQQISFVLIDPSCLAMPIAAYPSNGRPQLVVVAVLPIDGFAVHLWQS